MMKKICALITAITLMITLCSCKKINNDIYSSSYSEPIYSSEVSNTTIEILESNDSDTKSDIVETESFDDTSSDTLNVSSDSVGDDVQSTVSDNNSSETDSSDEKENNSSDNTKNDEEQYVYLTVDESRAPSTDVGSIIWNGYIYYTNPTSAFEDGLFRKKISGGIEEQITGQSVTNYRVLDEKVYYVSQNNLYSCNTDGSGIQKIYDGVSEFEVAGNWIFATGGAKYDFYAISTDGSIVKHLGNNGQIHGFNRGYCYVTIGYPKRFRIDYRSQNLTQENLKINAEYTYQGSRHYDFIFNRLTVGYDYVFQSSGGRNWIVSLKNNTASTLFESQMALPQCRLKDYYVYIPDGPGVKNCDIVFVDFNGNSETFRFDWSKAGHNWYQIYHEQDIHSNSLLIQTRTKDVNGNDVYTLHIVDSDGDVTEIYSKTP